MIFLFYFWTVLGKCGVSFVDTKFMFYIILAFAIVFNAIIDFYDIVYWKLIPFVLFLVISYFIILYLSLIVSYFAF
jgi:hypothetical protein